MKFKVKALEQEQHERHYIIEAASQEEAEELVYNNDAGKPVKQEQYNFEVSIDKIEILKD